jgi:alanine dehydrogenase
MSVDARARSLGLPRMHKEKGELRDFLPGLVAAVADLGVEVVVESGIGSGMGLSDAEYLQVGPNVRSGTNEEALAQDVVLVLRSPDDRYDLLARGATLVSMLHYPTRPRRVARLVNLGLEAVSIDSIADDRGHRLVVNSRAVAWNGLEAAFEVLEESWPPLLDPLRGPIHVTVLGAGAIGKHAVEAATKYGDVARADRFAGMRGVEVVALGRNMTSDASYLRDRLAVTDVLVDATQRSDPSLPVIANEQLGWLPDHAVICDCNVDPYLLEADPPTVRSVEGIPQGDLDRWKLSPDDPAWGDVPAQIPHANRRWVVSCYSWPGVHPHACMQLYGDQLEPLLRTLFQRGGVSGLRTKGEFHERALWRASLRTWLELHPDVEHAGPEMHGLRRD